MIDDIKAAIRADYTAGMSFRALAETYGIPKSTIAQWAKDEQWPKMASARQTRRATVVRRAIRESLDSSDNSDNSDVGQAEGRSEDYQMLRQYAEKLLHKADQILDIDDALAPRDLKSVSAMLLDVRTLLNVLSPRELAEQKARLRNLEKQAEQDAPAGPVVIKFVDTEGAED